MREIEPRHIEQSGNSFLESSRPAVLAIGLFVSFGPAGVLAIIDDELPVSAVSARVLISKALRRG